MMLNARHQTSQRQSQRLHLAAQQIQLLNFIQLNALELEQRIRDEMEDNPALDADLSATAEDWQPDAPPTDKHPEGPDAEERGELLDAYLPDDDYEETRETNVPEMPPFATNLTEQEDFRARLLQQISILPLTPRERTLAEYLIESLDDDGYLRRGMEDVCDDVSFATNSFVTEEELEQILLDTIQQLDPVGVGARDLAECLLLQLESQNSRTPAIQTACLIVKNHLEDLAQRRKTAICEQLSISGEVFESACRLIQKLNPKPVGNLGVTAYKNQNIVPEFVVEKNEKGELIAGLLNSDRFRLRINKDVAGQLVNMKVQKNSNETQRAARHYLKAKLDSARWFLDMMQQRENSMQRTIEALVAWQFDYFATGDKKQLKPLILNNIAEKTGLDVSTVSRVTSTKYVLTDFGLVPLKSLFNQGFATTSGELVTNQELLDRIKALIDQENPDRPLTDQEIADQLESQGYILARRTVAKYRDLLNIPSARDRQGS
ncbi:MAG: RNA polymerase factor sigma-54 [Saprospiraceae bacterium]